jgi:hypothetical protein
MTIMLYSEDEAIKDDTKPNGGKLRIYNNIKCNFKMEKYLLFNGDRSNIQCITRLRIIDSVLKEVDMAKIHFYILSGFVYIVKMSCSRYSGDRAQLIASIAEFMPDFYQATNIDQFHSPMRCDDTELMALFIPFISNITDIRNGGE